VDININLHSADGSGVDSSRPTANKEKELVVVEWRDIIATSGWEQEISCPTLFTVGWLISEDEDTILIANTKDPDDFTGEGKYDPPIYYGLHAFPSGAVLSISRIPSESYPTSAQIPFPTFHQTALSSAD